MKLVEWWQSLIKKKIEKKDLIIAILVFLILALIVFGWYYFKAKKNPLEGIGGQEATYRYLFSIYDPQHLRRPLGVAVSPWGDVAVTDSVNHKIVMFDRNGKFQKVFGGLGSGPGQFNYPSSVAISGKKLYVADFYNQRVQVVDFEGNPLSVLPLDSDRKTVGANIMPVFVAADTQGYLYVSDVSVQRILVFDSTGRFKREFGRAGANSGEISYVNGITVDDEGKGLIYLSNSNNGRIDAYSREGQFIKTLAGSKVLTNPKGITFDRFNRRIYVADTFAHQIFGLNQDGGLFETIGKRGMEANFFNFPNSVTIDSEGRLYVADRENNRVGVYTR